MKLTFDFCYLETHLSEILQEVQFADLKSISQIIILKPTQRITFWISEH